MLGLNTGFLLKKKQFDLIRYVTIESAIIEILAKLLGHSNIGITMNLYVHITEDEKHKEIELVAGALKVI